MQMIAWGMCMLQDRRPQPLTPPWAAWFTMFVVVSFLLLTMMPLVYDGPFARSGLLNYFYEFGAFFVMWLVIEVYTFKAINRLEQEHWAAHAAQ